jgi:hypothetical protein
MVLANVLGRTDSNEGVSERVGRQKVEYLCRMQDVHVISRGCHAAQ